MHMQVTVTVTQLPTLSQPPQDQDAVAVVGLLVEQGHAALATSIQ